MVRREVEIDEETDRLLAERAAEYQGDLGKAVVDLVMVQETVERFAERSEAGCGYGVVQRLRDRAEADFREGRTVNWHDLKGA